MKRFRSILFLLALFLLLGGASAHALLVSVEVLWGYVSYPQKPDTDPPEYYTFDDYHITEGSIIQIVAYQSGAALYPNPDEPNNTVVHEDHDPVDVGNFTPYGSSYLPDTTPEGHQIVATGAVTNLGNGVYGMVTWIDLPYPYDSLYVRVFEVTDFGQGVSVGSHWGISAVSNITDSGFGTALTWFDNIQTPNSNTFEVIPEPSSLSFLLSGGCGMGVFALFRRRRTLRPPEE